MEEAELERKFSKHSKLSSNKGNNIKINNSRRNNNRVGRGFGIGFFRKKTVELLFF